MSIFSSKLKEFMGTPWDSQIDINLCNEIIRYKQKLLQDQNQAQQYISNFMQKNNKLIFKASTKFQEELKELSTYMTEGSIKKQAMNKNTPNDIERLFNKASSMFQEANIAFENNSLKNFILENTNKVKAICESADSAIDTHRLVALIEASGALTEMTTADMSVYDAPVSAMRNRVGKFNPWGKNIGNAADKKGAVIKMDSDVLKESLSSMNIDSMTILGTDIDTTNKFSRVLVEHETSKQQLIIDRSDFMNFVKRNADVRNYIEEGKVNFKKYFSSRTIGFVGILIKEYFKRILKEDIQEDFQVDDYKFDGNKISIQYYYPNDTHDRTFNTDMYKFEQYMEDYLGGDANGFYSHDENDINMENPHGTHSFDFNSAWDTFSTQERNNLLKTFMKNNMGNEADVKTGLTESEQIGDYNQWKSMIATNSQNNYDIRRDKNSIETIAIDGKGRTIGKWNPNDSNGFIYK